MISETPIKNKYTYLALGDSYTIGEMVNENERFPAQLSAMLNSDSIDIAEPLIIAKTGWTTDELLAAIKEKNVTDTFSIVTLLIGVNNQYRGRDSENYRSELKQLLEIAVKYAGGKNGNVFVLSIPDWGVTPFAEGKERGKIAAEIDEYNRVKKEECEKLGVKFYDITGISRTNDPALIASDDLHPSGKMYKMWVDKIYSDIVKILR
ncbi:MAG TPA: SGNH/GDSL hydrolase family protein [Ignavibacteria bacterium]|nr:lysophospholipase [Bacteroidota bacterium]HRE10981.1 SGNH/GDSL hydrolase family protein [Ignavibacteria bacterium]HRF65190.1 SGNH/GDSL hydrolase family protein [Ignavibacteria bacterium]HRJ05430.1 SGNH/GDSL hydrolase family protein [Ignavibacteria bacterium]